MVLAVLPSVFVLVPTSVRWLKALVPLRVPVATCAEVLLITTTPLPCVKVPLLVYEPLMVVVAGATKVAPELIVRFVVLALLRKVLVPAPVKARLVKVEVPVIEPVAVCALEPLKVTTSDKRALPLLV